MSMKYLAAYALASLSKPAPTADDVKAICKASGIQVDDDSLGFVMEAVAGRSVATLVAEGAAKMSAAAVAAAPSAGGGAAAAGAAPAGGAAAAAPAKKQEAEEEEDDDMGFGLFD
uniref:Putative 60S acidic ribosomal protein n=1 Tax=Trypanosoma congolense (strain IL3000) TaxID=1068625 RepID=G0UTT0_TRYCI|nr:putative 60S acidic ribosomal protein [Trypanosoma congolense IL3000]